MAEWRTDTPPKDGPVFLADVGFPWPVPCIWCGAENQYVVPVPDCGLYEGEWNDWSWVNEYYRPDEIRRWLPMPELP